MARSAGGGSTRPKSVQLFDELVTHRIVTDTMTSEPVQVVDYDAAWPSQFENLAARARTALGELVNRVEHVGSTAVPGLAAKPIIDLDVVVSPRDRPAALRALAVIGYVHEGDGGIVGRDAFRWPPGEPRHHLYLVAENAHELTRHLAFRDALRADTLIRDRYSTLKQTLALRFENDRTAYTDGKAEFILSVLRMQGIA
jgi:GrpB-like predicted nucleotidyltransferase (UPF0157 family)